MLVRTKAISSFCFASLISVLPSTARADLYYSQNAPVDPVTMEGDPTQEINGSQGGLCARPLVAAGLMGLKFYKGNVTTEQTLLNSCKLNSPAGTTWKEGCDIGGLTVTMSKSPFNQSWFVPTFTDEPIALTAIIGGLKTYGSPILVPLYGHATHWATVYMVAVTGSTLEGLEWFDSGKGGLKDGQWVTYDDGVQSADGTTFANVFYDLINSSYLSPSDPYKSKYVIAYDPPTGVTTEDDVRRIASAAPVKLARSPGIFGPIERVTPEMASERVWDALSLSHVPKSPVIWPLIEHGVPGPAWRVSSVTPRGEPWGFYVVPLLDENGMAVGLVQLSDKDGAFEQVWVPLKPVAFVGVTPEQAEVLAGSVLKDGEQLAGGELTWDPSLDEPNAHVPLLPYYSYEVFTGGRLYCGRLLVMLSSGELRFHQSPGASKACDYLIDAM